VLILKITCSETANKMLNAAYRLSKEIDRLTYEVYKILKRNIQGGGLWYSAGSINFNTVVMAMMRLLMEAVMIIAIVSGMVFVTKVSASENNSNNTLRESENGDDDKDSDNV
jgi:hypothetical protein